MFSLLCLLDNNFWTLKHMYRTKVVCWSCCCLVCRKDMLGRSLRNVEVFADEQTLETVCLDPWPMGLRPRGLKLLARCLRYQRTVASVLHLVAIVPATLGIQFKQAEMSRVCIGS